MNIKTATITALALFAAAATSHGSRLAPSSSYYGDSEDEQEVADGKNDAGDAEAEEREPIDLSQLEAGDTLSFSFEDDFPEEINGYEVLSSFLPEGVSLEWTGKKLKAPKSGKVKYSKKDEDFVDKKNSDNPSGLSVKLNKKKGTVSGSFKIYVAKSEKKLKSYKAKFSGTLGGSLSVTLKKKVIATAAIE